MLWDNEYINCITAADIDVINDILSFFTKV